MTKDSELVVIMTQDRSGQSESAKPPIDARWEEVAEAALVRAGFHVVDRAGVNDYQGWGVLLGKAGDEFAVLSWSYGSCGMCDNYEDLNDEARAAEFDALVERGMTEQEARTKFDNSKGW